MPPALGFALAATLFGTAAAFARLRMPATLAGALILGLGLAGRLEPPMRIAQWRELPPREVTVDLRLSLLKERPAGEFVRYGGEARITTPPPHLPELKGTKVWVNGVTSPETVPSAGEHWQARGVIRSSLTGGDDFLNYLEARGIWFLLERVRLEASLDEADLAGRIRTAIGNRMEDLLALGEPPGTGWGDWMVSLLLGRKHAIPQEVRGWFEVTGTIHVMAVSGLHIGLIVVVLWKAGLLLQINRRLALLLALALTAGHVWVVGAPPSAIRAFTMALVLSAGPLLGRRYDPVAAVATAALLLAVVDPASVRGPGYQLSFLVVGALVLYSLPLVQVVSATLQRRAGYRGPMDPEASRRSELIRSGLFAANAISGVIAVSSAAFLISVPLTVDIFHTLPTGAILANLAAVPLASLALLHGVLSILAGFLSLEFPSLFFNHGAWVALAGLQFFVENGATLLPHLSAVDYSIDGLGPVLSLASLLLMLAVPPVSRGRLTAGFWLPWLPPVCGCLALVPAG